MLDEQLKFAIGLGLLDGVGPVLAKNLIAWCGSPEAVFREKKAHLMKVPGLGSITLNKINTKVIERAEKEVEFIRKNNLQVHFYLDKSYSQRLRYCDDGPLLLYSKGNVNMNPERMIAVVGTRTPSEYGKMICEKFTRELREQNITVVSGMAYGIDICAHRTCVQENIPTIGVMAHGLDRIYPQVHRGVAEKMISAGGLITEFISDTNPDRENFPKRNRIVAGMCDAVIVIETGVKGGSMITAMLGNDYNRDVFAFPGRSIDERSAGCNRLIRLNRAALIENCQDFIELMGWQKKPEEKKQSEIQAALFQELSETEEKIVRAMKAKGNYHLDLLALDLDLPVSQLNALLLTLEFKGIIKGLPGKVFALLQ